MNLNNEQTQAIEKISSFLESSNKLFLLTGSAGTGKSTIISQLFRYNNSDKKIVISATTNKAVSVLKEMFNKYNNNKQNIEFSTIQKICNIKLHINDDGEQYFKFTDDNKNYGKSIYDYNIIIIDESSMINLKLINYLNSIKRKLKGKIIYVGDKNQLPPVNESNSLVFNYNNFDECCTLNKVMRFDSNILKFSIRVIDSIISNKKISIKNIEDESFTIYKKSDIWLKDYLKCFSYTNIFLAYTNNRCNEINNYIRKHYFKIPNIPEFVNDELIVFNNFHKNDDIKFYTSTSAKIISCSPHTHVIPDFPLASFFDLTSSIESYQSVINMEKKDKAELNENNDVCPICYDEMKDVENISETECKHVFCDNCINMWLKQHNTCPFCRMVIIENKLVINENDILSTKLNHIMTLINSKKIKVWNLQIKSNLEGGEGEILVIRKEYKSDFELHKELIKKAVIDLKQYIYDTISVQDNRFILTRIWEYYYLNYVNMFADISYGYCITVHKSQGSTFDNVYIDSRNILEYNKIDKINYKCLYTGITRASKKISMLI